ncbi:hypothetical protein V8D89_000279 [Ganoderma adspersum]
MRLLDTHTGQFVEKDPDDEKTVYAILSHTWDKDGEQTYEQLRNIQRSYPPPAQDGRPGGPKGGSSSSRKWNRDGAPRTSSSSQPPGESISGTTHPEEALEHLIRSKSIWEDPDLSPKIREACRVARENGYRYIWIDSCCIDKSSSSELSEAINSMYKWYGLAAVCYAYLSDVPSGRDHQAEGSAFRKSRWFGRGWTLQELIAPASVEFFSQDWALIGSKHNLVDLVENITEINEKALLHLESLSTFSIAQRLSWAADRKTTREEDQAYSLLGIFDINMPTLYGEGNHAFRRLQEQIMQHIPDQSLFAWGDVYLSSQLVSADPIWEARPSTDNDWEHLFTASPGPFKVSGDISTQAHHQAIQLISSHRREMIEYTSTPYGIRTQFWMIPLTRDLLLRAIQWHHKDVQLKFSESSPENAQWYLTILGCEHSEHPGHLLGRVCYIAPSESGVEFLYPGYIHGLHLQHRRHYGYVPNIFPLSSETIQHYHQHIELKMVYIPHLNHASLASSLKYRSYTAIKLMLLRATHDALRSRGYLANLRHPDLAHPTTHWLILSKYEHIIAVEFQHTLEDDGKRFTIDADVEMSLSHVPLDSAPDSDQTEHNTVSWRDNVWRAGWRTKLDDESVRLSAAGAGTLTVNLGLDFAGRGVYFLRVDVVREAPPASSAVEPAIDQADEGEKTKEGTSSGAIGTEDADREDIEETGGEERAPSVDARDAVATSDNTDGGDGGGVLA